MFETIIVVVIVALVYFIDGLLVGRAIEMRHNRKFLKKVDKELTSIIDSLDKQRRSNYVE